MQRENLSYEVLKKNEDFLMQRENLSYEVLKKNDDNKMTVFKSIDLLFAFSEPIQNFLNNRKGLIDLCL
jgi:hypothetical protein